MGRKSTARWIVPLAGLLLAASVQATCTRPIEVPMAPIGLSVGFDGERAAGIYPTLLRELASSARCEFVVRKVPRARLLRMFETGQADLLMPASASPARDADGEFVPLIQVRASLLTLAGDRPPPRSLAELLALPDYKLAVVRGFSFGSAYDNAISVMRSQKRLVEEADAAGVARALRMGMAHATVMTASIFIGTLVGEPELSPLVKQLKVEPLEELTWSESGIYLSRHSLREPDRRTLRAAFTQSARSGRVWQLFNDIHPPGSLGESIRPL